LFFCDFLKYVICYFSERSSTHRAAPFCVDQFGRMYDGPVGVLGAGGGGCGVPQEGGAHPHPTERCGHPPVGFGQNPLLGTIRDSNSNGIEVFAAFGGLIRDSNSEGIAACNVVAIPPGAAFDPHSSALNQILFWVLFMIPIQAESEIPAPFFVLSLRFRFDYYLRFIVIGKTGCI